LAVLSVFSQKKGLGPLGVKKKLSILWDLPCIASQALSTYFGFF